jgi:hypothetical protein
MTSAAGSNPAEQLADLLDALDDHVRAAEGAVRRSEGNRISILYVHAVYALLIAPAFAAIGKEGMNGPTWSVLRLFPGAPYSLAAVMFLGGLVLVVATTFANRVWELVGLLLLMFWYAAVAGSFGAAMIVWMVTGGGGPRPAAYAPLVYSHFLTIMLVHCWTLRRMIRAAARRRG